MLEARAGRLSLKSQFLFHKDNVYSSPHERGFAIDDKKFGDKTAAHTGLFHPGIFKRKHMFFYACNRRIKVRRNFLHPNNKNEILGSEDNVGQLTSGV